MSPSKITTADHTKAHNPRTRKKIAFEVAKRIKNYVEKSKVRRVSVLQILPLTLYNRLISVTRI